MRLNCFGLDFVGLWIQHLAHLHAEWHCGRARAVEGALEGCQSGDSGLIGLGGLPNAPSPLIHDLCLASTIHL